MDILHILGNSIQAYDRASNAFATDVGVPPVGVWVLLIAAGVVLVEWLAARYRVGH
jgi:hypothetical protein